jgi:hypothetical protein
MIQVSIFQPGCSHSKAVMNEPFMEEAKHFVSSGAIADGSPTLVGLQSVDPKFNCEFKFAAWASHYARYEV